MLNQIFYDYLENKYYTENQINEFVISPERYLCIKRGEDHYIEVWFDYEKFKVVQEYSYSILDYDTGIYRVNRPQELYKYNVSYWKIPGERFDKIIEEFI